MTGRSPEGCAPEPEEEGWDPSEALGASALALAGDLSDFSSVGLGSSAGALGAGSPPSAISASIASGVISSPSSARMAITSPTLTALDPSDFCRRRSG